MGSKSRSKRPRKRKIVICRQVTSKRKESEPVPEISSISTSASKMKLDKCVAQVKENDSQGECIFIDLQCLNSLFTLLKCPECSNNSLSVQINTSKKMGCCVELLLSCFECDYVSDPYLSSKKQGQFHVINRRLVYAMKQLGCGHEEASHFMAVMNMPPPPNKAAYNLHSKQLLKVVEPLAKETMKVAAHRLRIKNDSQECGVSVDGSWQRRGYSSLNGVVSALSIDTGEVLDVEVLAKDCHGCRKWLSKDKNSIEYQSWNAEHICSINYEGSSSNMEPVGAVRIFARSMRDRYLQYSEFYGDGDSKSYAAVCNNDPYEGKAILKRECVGHYQKRLGTALRRLKKEVRGLGGKGKLTNSMINKMQNYFGMALRNNTASVDQMSKAIWSTFFHLSAKDSHPLHTKCPIGKESWCSYQRASARGQLSSYKHKGGLPLDLLPHIKPIYTRLTDVNMLEKCLHGMTQNNNECFHSLIWKRSPKTKFSGAAGVKLSVYDAAMHFNCGYKTELDVMRRMSIIPGRFMVAGVEERDRLRISESLRQSTPRAKQRRKCLRGAKKKKEDKKIEKEGPTYAAGEF